jgi:hypothetical protein
MMLQNLKTSVGYMKKLIKKSPKQLILLKNFMGNVHLGSTTKMNSGGRQIIASVKRE